MLATFDRGGLHLVFPQTWSIVEAETESLPYQVELGTPEGGFWQLHVYPESRDPAALADDVLATMRSEYADLDATPYRTDLDGRDAVGHEMDFFYGNFVITSRVLAFRDARRTYLVQFQAEMAQFEQQERLFEAVAISLVRDPLAR